MTSSPLGPLVVSLSGLRLTDTAIGSGLWRCQAVAAGRGLAADAGVRQPDDFARKWHILMKGSIVAAGEGDKLAARRAREVGGLLLAAELDGRSGLRPAD